MHQVCDYGEQFDIAFPHSRQHLRMHRHKAFALLCVFRKSDNTGELDRLIKMNHIPAGFVHFKLVHQISHALAIVRVFLPVAQYLQIVVVTRL